jgi:alpha-methylacyl-CoA racemase
LCERQISGVGQVVDAAMIDGSSVLSQMMWSFRAIGMWNDERGTNPLDSGAPYYDTYVCADGRYVAVGAIEPQFYAQMLTGLGLSRQELPDQNDVSRWPEIRGAIAAAFVERDRDWWAEVFFGTDACVTPVLSFAEVETEPHVTQRATFLRTDGNLEPAPAPRFSRSATGTPSTPRQAGADTDAVLRDWCSE